LAVGLLGTAAHPLEERRLPTAAQDPILPRKHGGRYQGERRCRRKEVSKSSGWPNVEVPARYSLLQSSGWRRKQPAAPSGNRSRQHGRSQGRTRENGSVPALARLLHRSKLKQRRNTIFVLLRNMDHCHSRGICDGVEGAAGAWLDSQRNRFTYRLAGARIEHAGLNPILSWRKVEICEQVLSPLQTCIRRRSLGRQLFQIDSNGLQPQPQVARVTVGLPRSVAARH
jgi:hypothetical protein